MSLNRRLAASVGANAYGQTITIGIQLLSLPVYLHFWDAARYGTWLLLFAIPSYFTMADIGMLTAAGNKMTMDLGRGDFSGATRTFQSALIFMSATCSVFLLIAIGILRWVRIPSLEDPEYRVTLVLLIATVLLAFFNGLAEAIFRSTGRYALGQTLGQSIRLAEWLGGIAGLWLYGSFVAVGTGMLVARAAGAIATIVYSIATTSDVRWGFRQASAAEVRSMARPAAMFMMLPIVNALSVQGFTLLVGGLFGTVQVALFNTYRTMARVTVQATGTLSSAAGPEMSRLYGATEKQSLRLLFRRANIATAILAISIPTAIGVTAPKLLLVWTHGRIPYEMSLLLPMLIYAGVSSLWHAPRILLQSINRHSGMALLSLFVAVASLGMGWLLGKRFSLEAVVWVLAISEMVMGLSVYRWATQLLGHRWVHDGRVAEAT